MNPSIYSIISTFLSFSILLLYYYYYQPDFVMVESDIVESSNDSTSNVIINSKQMMFSVRLAIVYSLLFSSMIGLFVLCVSSIFNNYEYNQKIKEYDESLSAVDNRFVNDESSSELESSVSV